MATKNENFHRLAAKRVVPILESLRIFSNLHSPNYEWTREEVLNYFNQVDQARDEAWNLFHQRISLDEPRTESDSESDDLQPEELPESPSVKSHKVSLKETLEESTKDLSVAELKEMIFMLHLTLDNILCQPSRPPEQIPSLI